MSDFDVGEWLDCYIVILLNGSIGEFLESNAKVILNQLNYLNHLNHSNH